MLRAAITGYEVNEHGVRQSRCGTRRFNDIKDVAELSELMRLCHESFVDALGGGAGVELQVKLINQPDDDLFLMIN